MYRRPLRAFTAIVFGTATFAVVGLNAAAPAGATPGPVALDSGPSGEPNAVDLFGASSAGILYGVTDIAGNTQQFFMRPTGGPSIPVPAGVFPSTVAPAIVGSMIGGFDGASTYTWTTVTGSASGTSTVPTGVTFLTVSFDGYLYSAVPSGMTATHVYDVNVTTHTTTALGAVPGNPGRIVLTPSTSGVLIETITTPTVVPESLYYVAYAAPTHLITLAPGAPVQGAPVVGTDTAAWIENPTLSTDESTFVLADTTVVRVGLDGSDEVRTAIPYAVSVALTSTLTGINTQPPPGIPQTFSTMPATGGALTAYPTQLTTTVLTSGNSFVVNQAGTPATAGLYTMPSAAGPATHIVAAGAQSLKATVISLSPGRATWVDNGIGAGGWTRPLLTTTSTITLGTPSVIAPSADQSSTTLLSSSGARTAYEVNTPPAQILSVRGPAGVQQIPTLMGTLATALSGTRLLQNHNDGSATLYNLVTGTSSELAAPTGPNTIGFHNQQPYQLSGNKLAWLASDGSVWVENLDTLATTQLSPATTSSGVSVSGSVAVAGDTVAWNVSLCTTSGFSTICIGQPLSYRNAATMGPIQTIPSAGPTHIDLSSGYLAYDTYNPATSTSDLYVNTLYTSTITDIAQLGGGLGWSFSLSGSTIGWLGTDRLAHVQALAHIAERPRYLGNGIAPSTLVADGTHTWNGDFVASTSLTACTVTIKSGSTTVRVLSCDSSQTPFGEGLVSWDGKNTGGTLVTAGPYTWTLTGANADGALLDADGGSTAITGTIAVTAPTTGGGSSTSGGAGSSTVTVDRISGADRFATAVAASQMEFPSGGAGAVVLARADDYADALVGGPLAAQKNAPLLLTTGTTLPAATKAELTRVLAGGGQVYLLGGTSAIPAAVEAQLNAMGYHTTRLAGSTRYDTAVAVADALGNPTTVLLATATNYPDALAAGPAAAHVGGAVLLTGGSVMPSETATYLAAHAKTTYAIGGPAAAAAPTAHAIVGADRYATAVAVATTFFTAPTTLGIATGTNFPDALAAGALLAHAGAPLLLTDSGSLPTPTLQYLTSVASSATSAHIFGGTSAVRDSVRTAVSTALQH